MAKRYTRVNIHRFIDPDEDSSGRSEDIFKSHAYSKAARSADASRLSLPQRREIARNRRLVGEYQQSQIGSLSNRITLPRHSQEEDAAPIAEDSPTEGMVGNRPKAGSSEPPRSEPAGSPQDDDTALKRRQHPIQPPRRNFGRFG